MLSPKVSGHHVAENESPARIKSNVAALAASTNRSLEDAFRLNRRIEIIAKVRCVLPVCGGDAPTSLCDSPFSRLRRSGQDAAMYKDREL